MPALLRAGLFLLESKVTVKRKEIYEVRLQKNNILKVKKNRKKATDFQRTAEIMQRKGL